MALRSRLALATSALAALLVAGPASAQEDTGLESPGMVVGGLGMMVAATPAVAFGSLLTTIDLEVNCVSAPCPQPDEGPYVVSGAVLIGAGLAVFGGGIALVVIGSQEEDGDEPSAEVAVRPDGVSLIGSF